jgi:hypothetical protein
MICKSCKKKFNVSQSISKHGPIPFIHGTCSKSCYKISTGKDNEQHAKNSNKN